MISKCKHCGIECNRVEQHLNPNICCQCGNKYQSNPNIIKNEKGRPFKFAIRVDTIPLNPNLYCSSCHGRGEILNFGAMDNEELYSQCPACNGSRLERVYNPPIPDSLIKHITNAFHEWLKLNSCD